MSTALNPLSGVTEILLIRHGETAWNAERRLQGHLDIPLNDEGLRQAAALGRALRSENLDVIFASDLQRAMQTADAIAAPLAMTVAIDAGLRERCFGGFEGLPYADIHAHFPEAHAAWQAREPDARFPQGQNAPETLREFSQRAVDTVIRLASLGHRRIAIVSHGGVLECIYRAVHGIGFEPARDFDILNASLNRIVWDGERLQIRVWGDVAHLNDAVLDEIDS